MEMMGGDTREPEEEGYKRLGLTVPDVKEQDRDFRELKLNLRFGFEGGLDDDLPTTNTHTEYPPKRKKEQQPVALKEYTTPFALCYPEGTRTRGCQELIQPHDPSPAAAAGGGAVGLPCTSGGDCPYVRFTCSRGHVWNAEAGTPACFYCPRCREKSQNIRGFASPSLLTLPFRRARRRILDPAARFRETVAKQGGKALGAYMGAKIKVKLRCAQGHEWLAVPENIVHKSSWCPICAKLTNTHTRTKTLTHMHTLATQAGGEGARCLSDTYTHTQAKLLWECAGVNVKGERHTFERSPAYIKKGLAIGRAFCRECAKMQKEEEKKKKKENGRKKKEVDTDIDTHTHREIEIEKEAHTARKKE